MAVILNVPPDCYCTQCVLDVAVVRVLLVRTPPIGDPTFDVLTVCRSTSR
jgi:hypothetical protein